MEPLEFQSHMIESNEKSLQWLFFLNQAKKKNDMQVCHVIGVIHHFFRETLVASFCPLSIFLSSWLGRKFRRVPSLWNNFEKEHLIFYRMHSIRYIFQQIRVMRVWENRSSEIPGVSESISCFQKDLFVLLALYRQLERLLCT